MNGVKDFFVKAKMVLDRGKNWISYVNFLLLVFVAVSSLKQYPAFNFLKSRYWLFIFLGAAFVGVIVLGYIDLVFLKTHEAEYEIAARMNPVQRRMFKNQDEIIKKVNKLSKKH